MPQQLIAKERFYYAGRNVEMGEEFTCDDVDVALLTHAVKPMATTIEIEPQKKPQARGATSGATSRPRTSVRLFGFEVTRAKASPPGPQAWHSGSNGWYPIIREPFTGAWQRNLEISAETASSFHADFACKTLIARDIGNGTRVVPAIGEDTWTIAGSQERNVQVIVVDVDRYGLQLVRDLHTVFPSVKIVALTNDPRRLAQAVRAGAAVAVPRSTPPADVAKLIRRLTRR